jgi:3-dehydroquinate synthase
MDPLDPVRIHVGPPGSDRHYGLLIGPGLAGQLSQALDAHGLGPRRVVVSTPVVWRHVSDALPRQMTRTEPVLLADGERSKTLASVARAYDALIRLGVDRATSVVAVGGGVLGDTAGFVAATLLRGLPLVHVPTTLLAQVDSAIGGKVGVNHALGKNLIGAFHPPRLVVIDPGLLATLPRREFRAGLYEVVKYAAIASPSLFATLQRDLGALFARESAALQPVIAECCRIKAGIVTRDEREAGERRVLNFGHTAGHALESVTKYRRFLHGEAVGYGMLVACHLAVARGVLDRAVLEAMAHLIALMGPLPPIGDLSVAEAVEATRRDKKVVDGRLHFVMPIRVGEVAIVDDVREGELADALRATGLRAR